MVEHRPNVSSGGRTSLIEIGQFLRAGGNGPEHQALLRRIGTLVDDRLPSYDNEGPKSFGAEYEIGDLEAAVCLEATR